jgi:hypothetical protein
MKDTLTFILKVTAPSGIAETSNQNSFSISPNPVTNNLRVISSSAVGFSYYVTDLSGKVMQLGTSVTNSFSFSTGYLPSGFYFLQIKTGDKFLTHKFIKQ